MIHCKDIPFKSGPVVTGAYLHTLSELIGWPFAALGLLIDNSTNREASHLKINLVTKKLVKLSQNKGVRSSTQSDEGRDEPINNDSSNKEELTKKDSSHLPLTYLELVDDGKEWTAEDFAAMIADFDASPDNEITSTYRHSVMLSSDKKEDRKEEKIDELASLMRKKYSVNLKIGGLRLGNSIVIFSKTHNYSLLGYISIQKIEKLHLPCNTTFLYSCWESSTGVYRTIEGEKTRKLILKEIEDFITEPELEAMTNPTGTKILIMNLRKIPIFRKGSSTISFEYELAGITNAQEELVDIHIRTLDRELKKMSEANRSNPMIEFSLKTYLSAFFLEENPTKVKRNFIELFLFGKKIEMINVKKTMERIRDEDEKMFVEFVKPKMLEGLVGCKSEKKGIFV